MTKPRHHGVGLKDKGFFHAGEREVAGLDSVSVAENFAKEGLGTGGQIMEFRGIFQGLKNLELGKSPRRNRRADGVKMHDRGNGNAWLKVRRQDCWESR